MSCIICGKPTDNFSCYGKKKGMTVSFCLDHISECEHQDECFCRITKN